jgi:two-component system capsular synthesis response regulator RcsB
MTHKLRVIVADDHHCVRAGIRYLLQDSANIEIVGEAADTHGLAELLDTCACEVVVSDIGMPGIDGASNSVSFLRRLLRGGPRPSVIVLTMICHPHMLAGLLHIGVTGIVNKRDTATSLVDAIEAVAAGQVHLSEHARIAIEAADPAPQLRAGVLSAREWEVFQLYVQGGRQNRGASAARRQDHQYAKAQRHAQARFGNRRRADRLRAADRAGLTAVKRSGV